VIDECASEIVRVERFNVSTTLTEIKYPFEPNMFDPVIFVTFTFEPIKLAVERLDEVKLLAYAFDAATLRIAAFIAVIEFKVVEPLTVMDGKLAWEDDNVIEFAPLDSFNSFKFNVLVTCNSKKIPFEASMRLKSALLATKFEPVAFSKTKLHVSRLIPVALLNTRLHPNGMSLNLKAPPP